MTDSAESVGGVVKTEFKDKKAEKAEKKKVIVESISRNVEDPNLPKSPEEEKASVLFMGLQESFKKAREEPNDNLLGLDSTVGSYRAAHKAMEQMDEDPTEVVKAISALREFGKQVGDSEYRVELNLTREELNTREAELRAQLEEKYAWVGATKKVANVDLPRRKEIIDTELKKLQEKDEQDRIKAKIREDIARMPERYARHEMRPCYEMMADERMLQGEISSSLPPNEPIVEGETEVGQSRKMYQEGLRLTELPGRGSTRFDAFEVQKARNRIDYTEENLAGLLGDEQIAEELVRLRQEGRVEEPDSFVPWNERSEEDRQKLISERYTGVTSAEGQNVGKNSLRNQILESMGQKAVDTFDSLPGDKRRALVTDLVQSEVEAEHAYNNIERSLGSGNASEISDRLNEAKQARLRVKNNLGQIQIALAQQRSENSIQILVKVARNFARGRTQTLGELGDAVSFGVEALTDKAGALVEPLKQGVISAADQAKSYAEGASEMFAEQVTKVSETVHSSVIKEGDLVIQEMKRTGQDLREKAVSIAPGLQRRRLTTRAWFWDKVGNIARETDRAMHNIALEVNIAKHSMSSAVRESFAEVVEKATGEKVLEDEDRARFERQRGPEGLAARRERVKKRIKERVEKKHEENPGFQYFWKEAQEYVKKNFPPEPEGEEPELTPVEATSTESEEPKKDGDGTTPPSETTDASKPKDKDRNWEPQGDEEQHAWREVKEQQEKAIGGVGNISEYRNLADALRKASDFLNVRLGDTTGLENEALYQRYQEHNERMLRLAEQMRALSKRGREPNDEEERKKKLEELRATSDYQDMLVEKWKIYEELKKKKKGVK